MQAKSRSSRWLLALAAAGLTAGPLSAVAPTIKDDAEFFSRDAVKRANEGILEIARKSHKDLLVETYPRPLGDAADKVKGMSREERETFYAGWCQRLTNERAADGIVIIVTREPAHLEVLVTKGAGATFDRDFEAKLRQSLLAAFREKKYDDGLAAVVKLVSDQVGARYQATGSDTTAKPPATKTPATSAPSNDGFEPVEKSSDKK